MFTARVERQIEAAHWNGPPSSRCHAIHGHSWRIIIEVSYGRAELNEWGWGVDFGAIKNLIDELDHTPLNESPIFWTKSGTRMAPSAENLAIVLFWEFVKSFNLMPNSVTIFEGSGNSVRYTAGFETKDPRNDTD